MSETELSVRLRGDSSGLVSAVSTARGAVEDLGNEFTQTGQKADRQGGALGRTARSTDELGRELDQTGRQARGAGDGLQRYARDAGRAERENRQLADQNRRLAGSYGQIRAAIAAVGITVLAREYVQAADTATLLRSRLRLVTESEEELDQVERDLFQAAQDTRSGYEETVELYSRVARASGQLRASQQELLTFTTAVNQAIQVSGASSAEAGAGVIQLSQGLASGVLRGEELNSVLEQTPRLAQAIADGMGISIGELRKLGAEGQLTAERVFGALLSQADAIEAEFNQLDRTVGGALQQLRNDLLLTTSAADDAGGAADVLIEAIDDMREIVRDPEFQAGLAAVASFLANGIGFAVRHADAIAVLAGAYATARIATLAWTAAQVGLNAVLLANPYILAAYAVGLLVAGLYALTMGGQESAAAIADYDRAMGDALGPMADFTSMSDDAAAAAANEALQHLKNAEAINTEMQARLLALRTEASQQLAPGIGPVVTGLAERGLSTEQILSGPESPFGPDVPYTNQTETAVARIVELTRELRAKGEDLRAVQREIDDLMAGFFSSDGGGGGGGGGGDETDLQKKLRKAREELEFEIAVMQRSEREQEILAALRQAGTQAIIAQGQSVEDFVAGLSAEERAIAQLSGVLFDHAQEIDVATQLEKDHAEAVEEAARAHADAVEDIKQNMLALLPPYRRALAEAQAWRSGALAALDETAEGYDAFAADVETIYDQMLADAYEEDLQNRRDWAAGVERTLREAADAAGDDARQFAELTEGTMARAEDAYVNFAKTGKLSLEDLGAFIEDWVLRYSFQKGIEPGLQAGADFLAAGGSAFFSSIFGGSSAGTTPGGGPGATGGPVPIKHRGGAVDAGGALRVVPHALFAGATRYHGGGSILGPGEVPIIARTGERVFTPEQFDNMSGMVAALSAIAARDAGASGGGEIMLRIIDAQGNQVETQQSRRSGGSLDVTVQLDQLVASFVNRRGSATRSALEGLGAGAPLRRV